MSAPADSAWDRYFHGEHGAARIYLLSKLVLGMLALDAWMLMIGHAGRYGAGGFNVAHFTWLDRMQPLPTPGFYLGVLMLTGLLSLWLMFAGIRMLPMLLLCALYTYSWAMSMLDSYQHHYFISLVLFCMAFFPRVDAAELLAPGRPPLRSGFGFPLLGALVFVVYVYTGIAKMDASWVEGHTIQTITSARRGFNGLMEYFVASGMEEQRFWSLFATFVIPQELYMGAAYLVAVKRDVFARGWVSLVCLLAYALVLLLHVGAEHMGLKIGWFSNYMLTLGTCYLLPLPLVHGLTRLVAVPARAVDDFVRQWEQEPMPRAVLFGHSVAGAGVLLGAGYMLDLPGAITATAIAAAALVGGTLLSLARATGTDPRRHILGSTVAAMVMWGSIAATEVRWDYYRYVGGDHQRRGELEEALRAYVKGERYAPEGMSRKKKIDKIRRELAER